MLVTLEEESRRKAQEVDCGGNQSWAVHRKKDVELLGQQ